MADAKPTEELNQFLLEQGRKLREGDNAPATLDEWKQRRAKLRQAMFTAMGIVDETPCDLTPKITGVLKRSGYRIEKVIFQSRPDVWVTANAYVPEGEGKRPAVLVVHGHWAGARRDPVVQARCLGLMHLGYFVLAVDAFGAGERYTDPRLGSYHGALYGSTLWPAGRALLGMQVYDNRRAVDYMQSRPEVDGARLGITGASGGGNQTMYAGALDERFGAVVPVCSVGTYQSYLRAACCVCEVLPGALRFTEEGDVLGLVAPRALLLINATRDSFNFSVGEAAKSLARAKEIFKLHGVEEKAHHAIFESPHAYNQAMRETMYGWMTKWLKNEGGGKPIPEPKHVVETWDELACYGKGERPASFMTPPLFAAREAKRLLSRWDNLKLDHSEGWEAAAVAMRAQLRKQILGDLPKLMKPTAQDVKTEDANGLRGMSFMLEPELGLHLPTTLRFKPGFKGKPATCLLLHFGGRAEAMKLPIFSALMDKGWIVVSPDLRGTGTLQPPNDAIVGTADHNSTEHALWVGRPLLQQWCCDVLALLDWTSQQRRGLKGHTAIIGVGPAGLVALTAAGLFPERINSVATIDAPASLVTDKPYPTGTRMGLLAPGLFRVGDVPHLAALSAPRNLVIAAGQSSQGTRLTAEQLREAYGFTASIYKLHKPADSLRLQEELEVDKALETLGASSS